MKRQKFSRLETVLRIRDANGWVRSEWTIRHDMGLVDVATFWPSGERIENQCAARVPLEQFCEWVAPTVKTVPSGSTTDA